jgi:hypothetical protein
MDVFIFALFKRKNENGKDRRVLLCRRQNANRVRPVTFTTVDTLNGSARSDGAALTFS